MAHSQGRGAGITIDLGSYAGQIRREFDYITIHIKHPGVKPHIPDMPPGIGLPPPTTQEYVDNYAARYLMTDIKESKEQYTYGERIMVSVDKVIERYKRFGSGTNQLIMQVGQPSDIDLEDPPCLRHIDTRIRDHKLHFIIYFRSWDLWSGFPANLAGFQQLKEYMAQQIGVEDGEMIVSSKGELRGQQRGKTATRKARSGRLRNRYRPSMKCPILLTPAWSL